MVVDLSSAAATSATNTSGVSNVEIVIGGANNDKTDHNSSENDSEDVHELTLSQAEIDGILSQGWIDAL